MFFHGLVKSGLPVKNSALDINPVKLRFQNNQTIDYFTTENGVIVYENGVNYRPKLFENGLNGLPVITFDGVPGNPDGLRIDNLPCIKSNHSIFCVVKITGTSGGNEQTPISYYNPGGSSQDGFPFGFKNVPTFFTFNASPGLAGGGSFDNQGSYAYSVWYIMSFVFGIGPWSVFKDGNLVSSGTSTSFLSNSSLLIGGGSPGVSIMKGSIARILIYDELFNDEKRHATEKYLSSLYGLAKF